MFGCCNFAGMMLLTADGKVDPVLVEAKVKKSSDKYSNDVLMEVATTLERYCHCSCHRNIPGSFTMC
jgi:hypothetical protein